jgi:hypothetical protein
MISKFIITTTGLVSPVKFEGLGSYHAHPTIDLDLLERFTLDEIVNDSYVQWAIDNGEITVVDENGDPIVNTSYISDNVPIFEIDNYDLNKSYIGYGTPSACNILRITTLDNVNYLYQWAEGEKNFTKIWANRNSYTYL